MKKYYSIHDIVRFAVVSQDSLLDRLMGAFWGDWDIELQGFASPESGETDFTVSFGDFAPDKQGCAVLDDKCYVREGYLYCRDYSEHTRFELEIKGFEAPGTTVNINCNPLGKMAIPEMIINHLIWLKLNSKGYPVVHAAGVSKDGSACVLAGQGASGKSTIALSLLERGFQLLGEHFVILSQGRVLSFSTPLHLAHFNLTPLVREKLDFKQKSIVRLQQWWHHLGGASLATKVLPQDIFPESLADSARLRRVFLLLPRENLKVESLSQPALIDHLVLNQKLESFPLIKYLGEYSYLFPESGVARYWHQYRDNLERALDGEVLIHRLEVPRLIDRQVVEAICQLI